MFTLRTARKLILLLAIILISKGSMVANAQVSQRPLLLRADSADPNLVLIFDDSGSMSTDFLYSDGNDAMWGGLGYNIINADGVSPPAPPYVLTYAKCSPQVNRIYYDPAKQYVPRRNTDGSLMAPGSVTTAIANAPCKQTVGGTGYPLVYNYLGGGRRYDLRASYHTVTYVISPGNTYARGPARTDCQGATCTYTEEIQNYANWYLYYRTRMDLAKSTLGHAFSDLPLNFRLGWGRINTLGSIYNDILGPLDAGVAQYDASSRVRFRTWLNGLTIPPSAFTPNRKAVNAVGTYFSRRDSDGPWGTNPRFGSTSTTTPTSVVSSEPQAQHASCRRAHTMLITDGYYTDYQDHPFAFPEVDNTVGPVVTGPGGRTYQYTPTPPYASRFGSTFADLAMYYWRTDLRPDLPNNVKTLPGGDPAFWQHMNFHGITLGVLGTLPQTTQTLAQITAGAVDWPAPPTTAPQPDAIDDMWHGTVNARGLMLNANDSSELTAAVQKVVDEILRSASSQAGVAASTSQLVEGSLKFIPVVYGGSWLGNVVARRINASTGQDAGVQWMVETLDATTGRETRNAIGAPSQRSIAVGNAPTVSPKAVPFTYSSLTSNGLALSISPQLTSTLVDFIRGDRSLEGSTYRVRDGVLGDIVNSAPTFVRAPIDRGYAKLPGAPGASYQDYLAQKRRLGEGALFVGANDGMLHVFGENDGREIFAYIPNAVLPKLAELASKNYVHRFYVDGPLYQADYHDGSAWRTAVTGTTGAGAKAVFAIDATNPTGVNSSSVLWEVSPAVPGFEELGHVLSAVPFGVTRGGQWVAVFGNGYESRSGGARLFVVDLKTGALLANLDTQSAGGNGLGGVRLILDPTYQIVGAYAGDLKGNVWRFDMDSANPADWRVGLRTQPLFSAGTAQPITAAPFAAAHPQGGMVVVAGTGKLYEIPDPGVTTPQSVYGIWDVMPFGTTTVPANAYVTSTASLVPQSISTTATVNQVVTSLDGSTVSQVVSIYKVGGGSVDWAQKRGWSVALPNTGQRVVYPVDSYYARIAYVQTVVPQPIGGDPCQSNAPRGYNYIIDPLKGGSPDGVTAKFLDSNGVSVELATGGTSTTGDGVNTIMVRRQTVLPVGSLTVDTKATDNDILDCDSGTCTNGHISACRAGVGTCPVRRTWRELFLRDGS